MDAEPRRTAGARSAREAANALLVALGIVSASMGIKGFLLSSNFIDGGVTGLCMLLAKATGLPLALWLPLVNAPFLVLAQRQLGTAFAVRSVLAIGGLSACLAFVPFPDVTPDLLLTAVFGGFFIGAGIGLAVRGGAVLDGTEVAALVVSRRSGALRVGDVILLFNAVLFFGAISVLGIEPALYSILTYLAAARTLDFVLHGIEEYTSLTIVSSLSAEIRAAILRDLGRGVTVYRGAGGLSGADQEILYCVVTRLEIGQVKGIVRAIDPLAFVVTQVLAEAEGGVVKRPSH